MVALFVALPQDQMLFVSRAALHVDVNPGSCLAGEGAAKGAQGARGE